MVQGLGSHVGLKAVIIILNVITAIKHHILLKYECYCCNITAAPVNQLSFVAVPSLRTGRIAQEAFRGDLLEAINLLVCAAVYKANPQLSIAHIRHSLMQYNHQTTFNLSIMHNL